MTALLLALALAAPGPDLAQDTVVELRRGDTVVLEGLSGEVSVETWARDELELRSEGDASALQVRRSGSSVRVERDDRKGRRGSVEAAVRVPPWVSVEVSGRSLDLWVDGVDGPIGVRVVDGDVWIRNAGGPVDVRTVEGEIDVTGARGGVNLSSQSDEVRLRDVRGAVVVHSGSGDLQLSDVVSSDVRAETQDGDIHFSGPIEDGGNYRFFVHDGDAIIAIPSESNARVSVSTFDGEFESEFPVLIERFRGGREFDFQVGEPRARIEIQVFDGEIRLLRRR